MAIDPIQFQGFTERQGFDPIKVPDPNPFLRENLGTIDASLRNLEQGNLANMKAKADAYSRDLTQLADFSQTLQGFLGTAAQIYDKKAEASANALYYEDLTSQENDIATLDEGERILQEGDGVTSKAAVAANRNGAPYSVSKRIAELGGLKGHYYRVKATQDIAAKYSDFYDEARRTDEREITFGPNGQYKVKINEAEPTEVEESAIRAYLREQYMEQFAGISRGMIAKYAFPTMRQVDESRATANADRIALRDSERERIEALEIFQQTAATNPGALQKYLDTVSRTVVQDKNGKVVSLQYGGSWKQMQNDMLTLAKAGKYVDLEGMVADMVNPDTGKKYMDDPMYSTKIKAIQTEIRKTQQEAFNDSQTNGVMQVRLAEQQIVSALPEVPTEADYQAGEEALNEVARRNNVVVDYKLLTDHRSKYGQTALEVKAKMQMYKMQQKAGLLDPADLLTEPPEIQQAFLESAKAQKQLREDAGGYDAVDKEFKALVLQHPFIREANATGASGGNSNLVYDHVMALHKQRTNELIGTPEYADNPVAASIQAFKELKQEVTAGLTDPNSIYYVSKDGFENFLNRKVNLDSVTKANRRLIDINAEAQTTGKAVLENEAILDRLIGKDTFVRAADGWGKPGYKMDPSILYLADQLQVSPLNVIHRGRQTFGMEELSSLRQLSDTHENASPDLKKAINRILSGNINQNHLRRVTTRDWPVRPTFTVAQTPEGNFGGISSSDHPFFVSIGVNEGTRTANGGYTKNFYGHTDPGDGHNNRGTVSGGRGNNYTPEEVDNKWRGILNQTQQKYANQLNRFASPGTDVYNLIMFNILDLRVQAPAAVPDFVKRIPRIIAEGATPEVIGRLRAESFINPRTGRLEASGFNNDMNRLEADQRRRAGNFRIPGAQ